MKETLRLIQPSFASGEVSPEVASRIDLDKYNAFLLKAKNAYIRPYGAVYKRGGTIWCGDTKYTDKAVMLYPFVLGTGKTFMLEIGDEYIRIWKGETYTGIELTTPFKESNLSNLRFCQSADVMYITSGSHPVKTLSHYSDTDWRFKDLDFSSQYFDATLSTNLQSSADEKWETAGSYTYTPTITGYYVVTVAGAGGGGGAQTSFTYYVWQGGQNGSSVKRTGYTIGGNGGSGEVKTEKVYLTAGTSYTITVGAGGAVATKGSSSSAFGVTAQGGEGGKTGTYVIHDGHSQSYKLTKGADGTSYGAGGKGGSSDSSGGAGWVTLKREADNTLTPSATSGRITLSSSGNFFDASMVGAWIKLSQEMPSTTVSLSGAGTSNPVTVGNEWKIITHGTWSGSVKIQKSIDGGEWKDFREYNSSNDNNISESGTVEEEDNVRMRLVTTAGNADLTSLAYTHEGIVQVESVNSATSATCLVKKTLGSTSTVDSYTLGSWNEEFGYPRCACFFQDRLCFAATNKQPYMVWMSRTGDYNNFSVEKVSGTVTDDSAVALSFISRSQKEIKHIVAGKDLIVLTDGNEWTVSGSETVKPSKATPQVQTSHGTTDVIPIMIGNRIIYVQRRGETVRDMGYSFESDAYSGMDLTLLAKSLVRDKKITDAAYMQDPDSRIYFTESDGSISCLSYIQDQKVYAWSHITTQGNFLSVCNVESSDSDSIYAAVKRTINGKVVTSIERLFNQGYGEDPMDYVMMDAALILSYENETKEGTDAHLAGEKAMVLSEGKYFEVTLDSSGNFEIPNPSKKMIIGLPYEMEIETPNIESNTQQGTLQGARKKISAVILRLVNSLGGYVGNNSRQTDQIKYEELEQQEIELYSGDKRVTLPNNPGFGKDGRIYITTKDPYPFNLVALIKEMVVSE